MAENYPYVKPINMLKLEEQVVGLFGGVLKKQITGKVYKGKVEGRDIQISCFTGKPYTLHAKSEEEWRIAHLAITQYLIYNPLENEYH